jgi:hypothetical protein
MPRPGWARRNTHPSRWGILLAQARAEDLVVESARRSKMPKAAKKWCVASCSRPDHPTHRPSRRRPTFSRSQLATHPHTRFQDFVLRRVKGRAPPAVIFLRRDRARTRHSCAPLYDELRLFVHLHDLVWSQLASSVAAMAAEVAISVPAAQRHAWSRQTSIGGLST